MDSFLGDIRVKAEVLDHIGIASDVIDQHQLVSIVDHLLPKKSSHFKLTHGDCVKAIILSGLGFQKRRLYSVDRFFQHRPVERIFRKGVCWKDFSDDTLAATLDKISQYGVRKFFMNVAGFVFKNNPKLMGTKAHSDTTSISVTADRITSLICLMVLTLFVNNFGEYILRKKLIRKNLIIKNQLGKDIRKPTFRWILERFQKIVLVKLSLGKQMREIVCNIDQEHVALRKCLGKTAQTFYQV